jgi:hypothetical protein
VVKDHIRSTLPDTLDLLQFAYRPNRSTNHAITIALHTALSQLEKRNAFVRMLFLDYSSAFNIIVPSKLVTKLKAPPSATQVCGHAQLNIIIKFVDGMKVVGLIADGDETAYRRLEPWQTSARKTSSPATLAKPRS